MCSGKSKLGLLKQKGWFWIANKPLIRILLSRFKWSYPAQSPPSIIGSKLNMIFGSRGPRLGGSKMVIGTPNSFTNQPSPGASLIALTRSQSMALHSLRKAKFETKLCFSSPTFFSLLLQLLQKPSSKSQGLQFLWSKKSISQQLIRRWGFRR